MILKTRNPGWLGFASLILAFCAPFSQAVEQASSQGRYMNPLIAYNLLPTTQMFGLPDLQTRPLAPDNSAEIVLHTSLANVFSTHTEPGESSLFDGELMLTAVKAKWKLTDALEMSLFLPYVQQDKGVLDDLIYDWHEWFGLPQGGRTEATNNLFNYRYIKDGETLVDVNETSAELGDIRVGLAGEVDWLGQPWLAQLEVKAPTGDSEMMSGSGGWDATVAMGWQQEISRFSRFAAVGISYLGDADLPLAEIQYNIALSGRLGFHWHATHWLTLTAQIDSHSPLYDSEIKELGTPPFQLTTGARFLVGQSGQFDISVGEDLNTTVSPDFVINLAAFYRW